MKELKVFLLLFVLPVFVLLSVSACAGTVECTEVGSMTGKNTTYKIMSGCYIEVNGRMIPKDSWRGEQDLKDND